MKKKGLSHVSEHQNRMLRIERDVLKNAGTREEGCYGYTRQAREYETVKMLYEGTNNDYRVRELCDGLQIA